MIDEQVVQDLECYITEFDCDPFDLDKPQLRSLASALMHQGIWYMIFKVPMKTLKQEWLTSSERECFHRINHLVLPYTNVQDTSPATKNSVSGGVAKADAMEDRVMASVIWLAESTEDKFTLAQVMQKSKLVENLKRL